MKRIFTLLITLSCIVGFAATGLSQGIYFDPSPTDVTVPARLYIDITSADCSCPELQDVDPETNPLYIWAWDPFEDRQPVNGMNAKNGDWNNSNENMKLKQDPDNPNLWYFDFFGVPMTQFYQQPAAVFYADGIKFLVKEKNGAPADVPEQKSPDFHVFPEPLGCVEKVCPFPTNFFQDQYFVITYDNNKETIPTLQNLSPDEAMIWYRISVNEGALQTFREADDKYKMDYDGNGIFSKTMIPSAYFGLAEGDVLTKIDVFITKAPINQPPFTAVITLYPGCD